MDPPPNLILQATLVAALMYGVAIGGLLSAPENNTTGGVSHLGYLLGSQATNGTLWCISVVLLLYSTLCAVFCINMVKQIEGDAYELFNEVVWKALLWHSFVLPAQGSQSIFHPA